MRDLMNNVDCRVALAPAVVADNTVQVGVAIDRQGFDSLTFVIATGVLADADATFAVTLEHGEANDGTDFVACAANDLLGSTALASFDVSADNKCRKIGYVGGHRYARVRIAPAANAGNAPLSAVAILGHPAAAPTSNPPA